MGRGTYRLTICLSLALGAVQAGVASASDTPAQLPFQVIWSGDKPDRMDISDLPHTVALTASLADTAFTGAYPLDGPEKYLVSGRLVATYGSDTPSLAVRLWPGVKAVNVRFYREVPTTCDETNLKLAERKPGNQEDAERSFFMARALYRLGDTCSDPMHRRAARAWFDRAYDLVTVQPFFDLAADAANAESEFDEAHVNAFRDKSRGLAINQLYAGEKSALKAGNYPLAAGLNQALQDSFGADSTALDLARLTLARLKADRKLIDSYLSAQPGSKPVPKVGTALGPGPNPD